jgi:hypothetical protein
MERTPRNENRNGNPITRLHFLHISIAGHTVLPMYAFGRLVIRVCAMTLTVAARLIYQPLLARHRLDIEGMHHEDHQSG